MSTKYIDALNGSDSGDGSVSQKWLTFAPLQTAINSAGNGIDRVIIDTTGAPLYMTGLLTIPTTAVSGITIESSSTSQKADIRAYRTLTKASFYQPDAVTYPNVWAIDSVPALTVLWDIDGANAYSLKWYAKKNGADLATVGPLIDAAAGSFSTVGTTLYFRPFTGNDPVNDAVVRVCSLGGSAFLVKQVATITGLMVGGTCDANPSTGAPNGGYVFYVEPPLGLTTIQDCYCYAGGKHICGGINGDTNSELLWLRVQAEQGSPYGGGGSQTPLVEYADGTRTGMIRTYRNCVSTKNAGLVGSTEGTTNYGFYTFISHHAGTGTRFSQILIDGCTFDSYLGTSSNSTDLLKVRDSVFDSMFADYSPINVQRCRTTRGGIGGRLGGTIRNCLMTYGTGSDVETNSTRCVLYGSWLFEGNTLDANGCLFVNGSQWLIQINVNTTGLTSRYNVVRANSTQATTAIYGGATSPTITAIDRNVYQLQSGGRVARFNTTNYDWAGWQGLGYDAAGATAVSLGLDSNSRPTGASACKSVRNDAVPDNDLSSSEFASRTTAGALEAYPT